MKPTRFIEGQAIYWLPRLTKSGESPYLVPGYVAGVTPKRIRILVQTTSGQNILRHVTAKRLQISHMPHISPRTIRKTLRNTQLHKISPIPAVKIAFDRIQMKSNRTRRDLQF